MISKSTKHNPNYLAKIVKVQNLRKHKNADRLMIFTVDGNNVITSNKTEEGITVIYFPPESTIDAAYLKATNSYRDVSLNADPTAVAGFFEPTGRVKVLKLREEKSEGYIVPIDTLEPLIGKKYLELEKHIGEEFDTVDGIILVKKYVVRNQQGAPGEPGVKKDRNAKIKVSKLVENQFRLHYDTAQFKKNLHRINRESIISVSWKMHGTSFVSSKVLCRRPLKWYEKALTRLGIKINDTYYDNIFSSRNVIKNDDINKGGMAYYKSNIHADANAFIKDALIDGETVYGEVVGYETTGGYIQKGYDYGCKPGEFKIFIYRVTHTNTSGKVIELPYNQVVERAEELGVEACPLIYFGPADGFYDETDQEGVSSFATVEEWRQAYLEFCQKHYVYDQNCQFCTNKVPAEGIVIRTEGRRVEALKLKAFAFLEYEGKELDKGEVNIEDETDDTTGSVG